ncbi:MAG: translocation/assembly module TamB domain-containing protein [Candidatus Thiodiazotropha sp. (ex Dulcina madagascariensis)]|nr:translocation/assembly module TamB domain-containing protein [Candidatus Thiodiazotropha sp. (ex Dulcina madagascariensis)]
MSRGAVKRVTSYLLVALLMLLLMAASLLFYFSSTHDGTRRLFYLAQRLAPGELQVDILEGRLIGPLELTGLSYRQADGLVLESERLYLDWRPAQLLRLRLSIHELALQTTRLRLPASEQTPQEVPAEPFRGVTLPLAVTVDRFSSADFEMVQAGDAQPLRVDRLLLSAATEGDRLTISELVAEAFSTNLTLDGSVGLDETLPMAINLSWRYLIEGGPSLSGKGELSGDLRRIDLRQQLASPLSGVLQAHLSEVQSAPNWEAEMVLEQVTLAEFTKDFPALLGGRLNAKGDFASAHLDSALQLQEPSLGELQTELQATYEAGVVKVGKLRLSNADGLNLLGRGGYHLQDGELSADLQWEGLRWPLTGKTVDITSDRGTLNLQGKLEAYRYRLAMQATRPELGPFQVDASGAGTIERVDLEALRIALQKGRVEGSGEVAWSPSPSWRMALSGEGVNPVFLHRDFPGDLAFTLSTHGEVIQGELAAELHLQKLSGSLRDYPLDAKGLLDFSHGELNVHELELVSGKNHMQINGNLGDRLAMDWAVDAPELASLWPGLSGLLQAKGKLGGTTEQPNVEATIKAGELAYQGYRIERLDGEIGLDLARERPLRLLLNSGGLSGAGKQWRSLNIDIKGSIPRHQLTLDLVGEQTPQLSLAGESGLSDNDVWQGQLQRLRLVTTEVGDWQLESAVNYRFGPNDQSLEPFCLSSGEARVCGRFTGSSEGGWTSNLQAGDLSLALLQQWLPAETRIAGKAGLQVDLSADTNGRIVGKAELRIPQGGLSFELGGGQQQVDFSGGEAKAVIARDGAQASLNLPLQGLGGFGAELDLPGLNPANLDSEKQRLKGRIKGGIEDLALLSAISPQLQNSRGKLLADFDLAGSLAEPRVSGDAKIEQGAVDIPVLGIELRELELRIQAPDLNTLSLVGSVRSGKGKLSLQGTTRLDASNGFPSQFKIEGKEWVAVNVPEAEVHLSPNLTFAHNAQRSELQGEIHLPYARIRPREIPESAVSDSSDLVVVGGEDAEESQQDPPLHAKIRLSLGKRVSFDGFGLRGKFSGGLLVIDEPGRPVIGRGRLGITEGVYQAYGQDLKIERGFALFADSPVDNPGLDVRAVREIGAVTAGMRVTGTMKKPKLKLFSTPAMSETDVISYLITGRPAGESSGKTVGVFAALQASGASNVASELGRQLGLEELRLDTGNSLEEAALVAGTYLSPRLYVQYVNELATSETKVRMRYDLTDRWQLEAETGRIQAGDFFYTFDR